MAHTITGIDPGSPAARAGLRAGDRLVSIDGERVVDFLDYQALTAVRRLRVTVRRGGEEKTFSIRKGEYTPLGLEFETPMMSPTRLCCNKCLFCFVDQLPGDARESMRVKDDDWRMSLMMGSYVTLTNVSDAELQRIIRRHASPLYISVHCTDPELRAHVLGTPRAALLMEQLRALSAGGIEFHCQCVLCPGINDGPALDRTIRELSEIPGARSLALVPVGLTGHREGLCDLHPYTRDEARAVLEIADLWRDRLLQTLGTRFVFPSDEFYVQGGWPIPRTRPMRITSRSTTAWACCGFWIPNTWKPGRTPGRRCFIPTTTSTWPSPAENPPRRFCGTCWPGTRWPGRKSTCTVWKTPGSAPRSRSRGSSPAATCPGRWRANPATR